MTQFLQSNVSLVVGALLLLVILGVRALTGDKALKQDLQHSFNLFFAFLVLRLGEWALEDKLRDAPTASNVLRLGWMLLFAFGVIRTFVSVGLWAHRFRRRPPLPKILRDSISVLLYALASLPIIKATLKIDLAGLVATSAILSVVIGLAMQDTLGNLFAGLSLQVERPFEVGDTVTVDKYTGVVAQIGWRATRIETFRAEHVTLPNNVIAKAAVMNYSRGGGPVGTDVSLGLSYDAPPNQVKAAILDTLREIPEVLQTPAPVCRTSAFEDSAVKYLVRFWTAAYGEGSKVQEQLHTRLWYRFAREGIDIPFPQRVVHLKTGAAERGHSVDDTLAVLTTVDLLRLLKPQDLKTLATEVLPRRFGAGERIISEGDAGNTFYVVASGRASVRVGHPEAEIVQLGRGEYFGEMSLLTGEPRSASVVAIEDSLLYEITRPTFARILASHKELAGMLSDLLARRRTELKKVASSAELHVESAPEAGRIFSRLRELFGLAEA